MRAGDARRRVVTSVLLALVAATAWGCIDHPPDDAPTRDTLQALLASRADRAAVEAALGKRYTRYEKGTDSWAALTSACSSIPKDVAARLDDYPKIMFYTTIWTQTWIFLDERDTMRHFVQAAQ